MRKYSCVSSDSHLECSPDMWRGWVDPEFRDWVPAVVKLPDGGDGLLFRGATEPLPITRSLAGGIRHVHRETTDASARKGASYSDGLPGSGGPDQRVRELEEDGVDAEILFPAIVSQYRLSHTVMPPEASCAIARGYNDWLSQEFCAFDPDRLLGCAMLPVAGIEDAVAELERVADLPGIRTVLLAQWPNGSPLPQAEVDDAFWEAVLATGVPLSAHGSFGGGRAAELSGKEALKPQFNSLITRQGLDTGYCVSQLITCRVFERYPELRIAFAETGAGWVPFYAEQADTNFERHSYWWDLELEHPPSYYVGHNCLWGIQDDYVSIELRHRIGVDNIMWASDFPHHATDWPNSHGLIKRLLDGVPPPDQRRIICDNAVEFFKLNGVSPDPESVDRASGDPASLAAP
jgi:predicted TIM-barrel fold metal-dependent hydrolase